MRWWGWLVLAACSGGDKDPDGTPDTATTSTPTGETGTTGTTGWLGPVAGSRLRPMGFTAPGDTAVRVLHAWWDTVEETACRFARHGDGSIRCLPIGLSYTPFFLDATCETPGYQATAVCDPVDIVLTAGPRYGCREFSLEVRSAVPEPLPDEVYSKTACAPIEPPSDLPVYRDEGGIPASRYVEATERRLALPGPIDVRAFVGADGSAEVTGFTTDAHGPCSASRAIDGETRCLPSGSGVGFARGALLFSDDACTEELPFFFRATTDCAVPTTILEGTADGTRVFESLGRFEGPVFSTRGGGCEPWQTDDSEFALVRGDEIPADTFPVMSETRRPVPGRTTGPLELVVDESSEGALRASGLATSDGPCNPVRLAADTASWICLPDTTASWLDRFADAACTIPVGVVGEGSPRPPHFVELESVSVECADALPPARVVRAFTTGNVYLGPRFQRFDDGCGPDPVTSGFDTYSLTEIDPTTFPALQSID